jgi:shikimate dehydrogenase
MAPPPGFAPPQLPVDRYVVIGNPVAHSLSPEIHARFAAATGEALDYQRLLAAPDGFAVAARAFFDAGGCGANVTLPFKEDALRFADRASERARLAGAANFLVRRDGAIEADNTDGAGLANDLARMGVTVRGASVLLLGAGGAARGVIAPLLALAPRALHLANRTGARAAALAAHFTACGGIVPHRLDGIPTQPFDLVINATSTSTRGESLALPEGLFREGVFAYDMAYGAAARPFVERALAAGARASDGLGMLVEQAAESFALWRGRRPDPVPVLAALRARLA